MKNLHTAWRAFMALTILFLLSCKDDSGSLTDTGAGSVFVTEIYSEGLDGNLLGDNPWRELNIYLPPGYRNDIHKRYPVVYMLHRYDQDDQWLFGKNNWKHLKDLRPVLDDMIESEEIQPMIIVSPNARNFHGGSWYVNSSVTGRWADFIVNDLVDHMDENYRTIPFARSRGIGGAYMGGNGAMRLAMLHPDKFGSVYGISSSFFKAYELGINEWADFYGRPYFEIHLMLSWTTAFLPRPDISHNHKYSEIWKTVNDEHKPEVWEKFVKQELLSMIDSNVHNLKKLVAIQFDCCAEDVNKFHNFPDSRQFSNKLKDHGIEHNFLEHQTTEEIPERIINHVLPFFSEHLESE